MPPPSPQSTRKVWQPGMPRFATRPLIGADFGHSLRVTPTTAEQDEAAAADFQPKAEFREN